jgi:tRNA A-37 threonylcarbamoyl transferase component Bud32
MMAAVSIVEAYAELHQLGVIHADVHPKNALLCRGEARIIDFSLSLVLHDERLRKRRNVSLLGRKRVVYLSVAGSRGDIR